ncbi:beta-N-acetylhexosaminidase [Gracilibacillus caseinilyticus]|uniref:Beta-N-acetylhexosaminidase n=1 Tax=Gracilibacillus caseinilyticus TaxID=2932256 RepID=A0ABY4F0M7_9BACI|nr:beta-N-acetylhexosaminidase [Gracilibacillus caseinilyticus]UOQ49745.1 beta-N-acetylhexosaminidase [Gracilibacillus caseinilyticus]
MPRARRKKSKNKGIVYLLLIIMVAVVALFILFTQQPTKDDQKQEDTTESETEKPAENTDQIANTIEQIHSAAAKGTVPDIPFVAGETSYQQVQDEWGDPDQSSQVNGAIYAVFADKTIGYQQEMVFDIRSAAGSIQTITYQAITKTLGEPTDTRYFQDDTHNQVILVSHTESGYELKWILPQPSESNENPTVDHISVYTEPSAPSNEKASISSVVAEMSLREKIGQMILAGVSGTTLDADTQNLITEHQIGGFIFYANNLKTPKQTVQLFNQIKRKNEGNRLPLFLSVDQEGGEVERLPGDLISFPTNQEIGERNNAQFSYQVGVLLGQELNAFGFNLDFAPVMDVNSNPDNPIIGNRSFGDNPEVVSKLGVETMKGILSQDIISVIKHFPGHGDTSVDSHLQLPTVNKEVAELEQLELVPFERAIANGADVVMVAHILLPAIDPEYPSSMSRAVITDILRGKLEFDGVIMTDDMTMKAITNNYSIGSAAVQSVKAGNDILLIAHGYNNVAEAIEQVTKAVQQGEISEQRINESVTRVIQLKRKYELTNENVDAVDIDKLNQSIKNVVN